MAVCKDQVLDPEDFTSPVYTVDNYRNTYSEDFALDPIRVEDLESSVSCLAPLVQKKSGRPQKKRLRKSAQKRNKAKRHCTICGSENHNRRRCDQEPNADSHSESPEENDNHRSLLHSGTESTWNGFSDDDKEQSSGEQGMKYKKDFLLT